MEREVDDDVLSSLFKDAVFPKDADVKSGEHLEYENYLTELSSFGIHKLANEPQHINACIDNIKEETQNLAFRNYKTFIQTAECSRNILQDFQIVEKHVDSAIDCIPALIESCKTFTVEAKQISISRKANTMTLARHTQLLEILEIPQLMDTCTRNCYFDEALHLSNYVQKLHRKKLGIPLIENIIEDVGRSCSNMLNKLLVQLTLDIQLPACLRILGYLRRLNVFSETQLRIKFLQARDIWLKNIFNSIPNQDAYQHIIKVIEVTRVHLFDVLTQYNAVFTDSNIGVSTDATESHQRGVYYSWIIVKIGNFLRTLSADFELDSSLASHLDVISNQCCYFGLSFSRVGIDFRPHLHVIFKRFALKYYTQAIQKAKHIFLEDLNSVSSLVTLHLNIDSGTYTSNTTMTGPPMRLLDHNSLAVFCNSYITACVDLRRVTPRSLDAPVRLLNAAVIADMTNAIEERDRIDKSSRNPKEQQHYQKFIDAFHNDLCPFIELCTNTIFA